MVSAGKERVRSFEWKVITRRYLEFYGEVSRFASVTVVVG